MKLDTPTYESLVQDAEAICRRRVAELKQAAPLLRELHADIEAITSANIALECNYSFTVMDGRTPEEHDRYARRKPALRIGVANIFRSTREQSQLKLINLLCDRGWVVLNNQPDLHSRPYGGTVLLGKKGIRARLHFEVPASWFDEQAAASAAGTANASSPLEAGQ